MQLRCQPTTDAQQMLWIEITKARGAYHVRLSERAQVLYISAEHNTVTQQQRDILGTTRK